MPHLMLISETLAKAGFHRALGARSQASAIPYSQGSFSQLLEPTFQYCPFITPFKPYSFSAPFRRTCPSSFSVPHKSDAHTCTQPSFPLKNSKGSIVRTEICSGPSSHIDTNYTPSTSSSYPRTGIRILALAKPYLASWAEYRRGAYTTSLQSLAPVVCFSRTVSNPRIAYSDRCMLLATAGSLVLLRSPRSPRHSGTIS